MNVIIPEAGTDALGLSTTYVNSLNQLTSIKPIYNEKNDIYSTIKLYLETKVQSKKSIIINYSIPSNGLVEVVGKNYLEQFSVHGKADCIFIMKFSGHLQQTDQIPICGTKDRKRTIVEWITHYFNARQTPDYYMIIDVVRKKQYKETHMSKNGKI